jgi:hypothetical protein
MVGFSALPIQVYGPVVLLISVVRIEPSTIDTNIFNAILSQISKKSKLLKIY